MKTMKAWQVTGWGEPEAMTLAEIPIPEPGAGEIRIANRGSGMNFFDILLIQGKYQVKPPFPFTPGAEVAGIVDAVGAGVSGFKKGDRVLSAPMLGGFAEFTIAPVSCTFPIPEGMDFAQAAGFPVVYHTSYFALERRAVLKAGEWLLVHAGASGTGMAAVQIGKAMGARVIATAGSPDKLEFCRSLGADHAIGYQDPAWVDRVKEITGRGADVIYDPVGGDVFDLSTKCIATEGRLLVVGFASGRIPAMQMNRVLLKDIAIVGVHWGPYVREHPAYYGQAQSALASMKVRPVIGKKFKLEEAPAALRELASRKIQGKAVLGS